MKGTRYYIVDVFAEKKYAGNQLAVILPEREPDAADMQRIANEFHFSETSFVLSRREEDGGFRVRIFTPGEEVPFAGHPTLGTAYIIAKKLLGKNVDTLALDVPAGRIPVMFNRGSVPGIVWMKQLEPLFGGLYAHRDIAPVLGLSADDLDDRFPVQEVSTGLGFVMVPLRNMDAVGRARTDITAYRRFFHGREQMPLFIFCAGARDPENHLHARMYADLFGIPEDPATGSAAGCLAGYMARYEFLGGKKISARMEQGYEMGRESILYLEAEEREGKIVIHVGGRVVETAEGVLV